MSLLFIGGSMQAQSVSSEQMDERFNDGTNLPYGWFTEGWTVKDGAIQTKASSGSSLDLESLFGGGGDKKEENTETEGTGTEGAGTEGVQTPGEEGDETGDQSQEEEEKPSTGGMGDFDISSLLSSLLGGGGSSKNYLLTPPVVVKEGENLVFSAKKAKTSKGSGTSISFGSKDTSFVVERSIYSQNKWVRVADFTTELDTLYNTFTVTGTPAGEYRFRFKAGGTVLIDSVAGFHIDNEAPDIYVIENNSAAKDLDLGLCYKDSTRTLKVINTATGTLNVGITSASENLFTVNPRELAVAAADTAAVDITFNFAAGQPGKNEAEILFKPADERVHSTSVLAMAVVSQPNVWVEDFNSNVQPKGFFTEGWEFHDNVATTKSNSGEGIGALLGGSGTPTFLMTPPLNVESVDEALIFSVKGGKTSGGIGSLLGGGSSSSVVIEKSVYGSSKWEKVREFTEPLDSTYKALWVSYIEPGEYRFRIVTSDSIVVDSIAGFHLDNNAPDIYILHNNTAAGDINYGMPQENKTETFAIVNTGMGTLQVNVETTDESVFALSGKSFAIEANDTAFVDVTYVFDEQNLGIHQGAVKFTPTAEALSPLKYSLTAYSTYADAWTEDFEPEFIVDDETLPREFPAGWETTGWEVRLPDDGDLMSMLSGLLGGGNAAPKSWAATTKSESYELVTPRLQAKKGDVLRFQVELSGDISAMLGGGASGQLNVYYNIDTNKEWIFYDSYVQNGYAHFVAPYTGVYQLRFTSKGASVDNFIGFHKPIDEVTLSDNNDESNNAIFEQYGDKTVNVVYDRTLSAIQQSNGSWIPCAYIVSLPYDYDFTDYYEADVAKIYRLRFKEEYYKQFVFLPEDGDNPHKMLAGRAYLVVVLKDQINLSASGVKLSNEVVDDDLNEVYSFEDWYFDDKFTTVGKWTANMRSISDVEADNMEIYGMRDDGTWARFQSEDGVEKYRLLPFRGYFDASENAAIAETSVEIPGEERRGPVLPGIYKTQFQNSNQNGTSTGESSNYSNMQYVGEIPNNDDVTSVEETTADNVNPAFRAINEDGTSLYFDLLGRQLNKAPERGIYIEGGKKMLK